MNKRPRKAIYVDIDDDGRPIVGGKIDFVERKKKTKPTDLSQFTACKIFAGENMFTKRRQIGYVPYDIYCSMSFDELQDYIRQQKGNQPLHFELYGGDVSGSAARFVPPLKTIYEKQPETDPRLMGALQENEILRRQLDEQGARIDELTKMVQAGPVQPIEDEPQIVQTEKGFFDQVFDSLGDAVKQKIMQAAPALVDGVQNLLFNQSQPTMADTSNAQPVQPQNGVPSQQQGPESAPAQSVPIEAQVVFVDPYIEDEPEKPQNYSCGYDDIQITRDVPNSIINLINDICWKTSQYPDGTDAQAIIQWMRGAMGAAVGVKFKQETVTQSKAG